MEIKTKEQLEDEWGPAKALSPTEIINMFKWAKLKKTDVFYDLGSGHGRVVRGAIEHGKVKKAIGIEHEDDRFCKAREIAKRALSKNKLKKIDFWLGDMEEFDISNATVVYEGHDPYEEDKMYRKLFKRKKGVKIIKRHLPLIGYRPVDALRSKRGSWFFLMKTPLKKHRTYSKREWFSLVLGKDNVTMDDFLENYDKRLKQFIERKERKETIKDVKKLIRKFLPRP